MLREHDASEAKSDTITLEERDWKLLVRDHILKATKPLIVIVGPTASGKTGFSIQVANYIDRELKENFAEWHSGAEVVNADSRQLYRWMDIGTAKITEREMQKIPHHLIDVLEPNQEVTIAWYKRKAEQCIAEIQERGNVPLLVGGSMLYISAVIDGLLPLPSDLQLRASIEDEYDEDQGMRLHQHLTEIDPATAGAFHHRNKPYVVRATEIHRMTGLKPSDAKQKQESNYDLLIFGMHWKKAELDERIERRTAQLMENGWIEEAENLLERGFAPNMPGFKSTGYREIAAWLTNPESMEKEELLGIINRKTKQYAKRQLTWWKGDERIRWLSLS